MLKKMKVLWTVNLCPTELSEKLGIKKTVLGGWVESMASQLRNRDDITLGIACKSDYDKDVCIDIDNIRYYVISYQKNKSLKALEDRCREIYNDFKPDIIHIEGTEFKHALAMTHVAECKTVVSLQGILNGQYNYQYGLLQFDDLIFSPSVTKMTAGWLLYLRKHRWYKKRMRTEKAVIENADYIMGRTSWDRAYSYTINPEAEYYSCKRVLRDPFYEQERKSEQVIPHSIYVGNGYSVHKGFHFVIEALPQLIREYPDVKVYVGGARPYEKNDKRPFYKRGYGNYLRYLAKSLGVEEHIEFLGEMDASEVAQRLAMSHVYLLPSVIENSPNTLGEAMMIGTPSVAAYVGGVSDMAEDGKEALFYRAGEPSCMAYRIKQIFDDDSLGATLSENGKKRARENHSRENNATRLTEIYAKIMESEK